MTMMSVNAGSAFADFASLRSNIFQKLGLESNSGVTRDAFVAARPQGVSEGDALALFETLTASSSSSAADPSRSNVNLSSGVVGALLEQQGARSVASQERSDVVAQSPVNKSKNQKLFEFLDLDGDGNLSKAEFVTARPDGVTEVQAIELFNAIDTDRKGAINFEQFEEGVTLNIQARITGDVIASKNDEKRLKAATSYSSVAAPEQGQRGLSTNV